MVAMEAHRLDNPVFSALNSVHAPLARTHGTARAYIETISPFMGAERLDTQGWADLAQLDTSARLIGKDMGAIPAGSNVVFHAGLAQMIAPELNDFATPHETRPLTDADVPAMLDLTERTKPGPFRERTIGFGGYVGIFQATGDGDGGSERLVAMAGRRMQTPEACEISAVCTDPSFMRQGAATQLTRIVAAGIHAMGKTAFLHVSDENPIARKLYETLGFSQRAQLEVCAVVFAPAASK